MTFYFRVTVIMSNDTCSLKDVFRITMFAAKFRVCARMCVHVYTDASFKGRK